MGWPSFWRAWKVSGDASSYETRTALRWFFLSSAWMLSRLGETSHNSYSIWLLDVAAMIRQVTKRRQFEIVRLCMNASASHPADPHRCFGLPIGDFWRSVTNDDSVSKRMKSSQIAGERGLVIDPPMALGHGDRCPVAQSGLVSRSSVP